MKPRYMALMALVCAVLFAAPVKAQQAVNAMQDWGLLGAFSSRCDMPPSMSNAYYIFAASADGRVYLQRDFGDPDKNDRSEVVSAVPRADGTLALTINFPSIGQARLNVYTKAEGRVRVVYNSRSDNSDVTVENGVLRHNGQPTPWSQRCR